jgi:hypothetical protein
MTKQDYLDYGKEYLTLKSSIEQWKFGISIEKKFPKAKFKIFEKWMIFVNQSESNTKRQQTKAYYLDRLEYMLSAKK